MEWGSWEGDCKMKRKDFVAWEQSLDGPTILTDVERVCAQLKIAGEDRDNDDEPVLPAPGPTARIVDHDAFVQGQIEARNVALEFCADIADQHASCEGIAQTIAAEIRAAKTNSASAATTLAEPADDDEPVLPAPGKVVAHLHNAQRCQERRAALQAENAELRAFITHQGFQRCDVPTCNCGSYHGGHAFARFHEIGEALVEAGARSNGSTVLTDVKRVLTENVELVAALTKSEQPGGCIISRTAPIAHCCKNCDALLLLARLATKETK